MVKVAIASTAFGTLARPTSALAYHGVEIAQQRAFECNTESNQGVFHRRKTTALLWTMERACWKHVPRQ
jgi:hypothetical protein